MNAKSEFIQNTNGLKILCCQINVETNNGENIEAKLTTGWCQEEYDEFIKSIDVEYDSGYGGQRLFGTIWFTDGTWFDRGEYDGSEWWHYNICPIIPEGLNRIDKVRDKILDDILGKT